ncbi:MAG TPA: hypothetical protein DDZ89_15670, partial [Clostridiales bacterium]|nr:hypothetical protein [Clostridiales bacterium]
KGVETTDLVFTVTVIKQAQTDVEAVSADAALLTDAVILNGNSALNNVMGHLTLPTLGANGSTISWTSNNTTVLNTDGTVARPAYAAGNDVVSLTATISKGVETTDIVFTVTVIKQAQTDAEAVSADATLLTDNVILNGNSALNNVTGNLSLPTLGANGSTISWASNNTTVLNADGTVTRPTYTAGNIVVTLTATVSKGTETTDVVFTVTVIKQTQTDAEAVSADATLLTDDVILNGNSALNNVVNNLSLPTLGANGSTISWASDNTTVLNAGGIVTRPAYTAGNVVVTLTATVSKGVETTDVVFIVTVIKQAQTDAEAVSADAALLTDDVILNENSDLNNVLGNLILPALGANGSTISWESNNTTFLSNDGTVIRPSYTAGSKTVVITATIKKGVVTQTKSFGLTIKASDITDEERVSLDYAWLTKYNVLELNPSINSVEWNLSFPVAGPNNSVITWESDMLSVITNDGTVIRPEYGQGHKSVNVTATVTKGIFQRKAHYIYVVLQKPDLEAPMVVSSLPFNNGRALYDTKEITLVFNENIILGPAALSNPNTYGIKLQGTDTVLFRAAIENENKLIVSTTSGLSAGEYKLIIPAGTFVDKAGNQTKAYELIFMVSPKPGKLTVVSSTPKDLEVDVDVNIREILIQFDSTNLVRNTSSIPIFLREKTTKISRSSSFSVTGDTVTLRIPAPLSSGLVYEIVIPGGIVKDSNNNINEEKIIQFRTKYSGAKPVLVKTKPVNGQMNVSLNDVSIELEFSQNIDFLTLTNYITYLVDDQGNKYNFMPYKIGGSSKRWKLTTPHLSHYKQGTTYTLVGPYGTLENPDLLEFNVQFTTASNRMQVVNKSPKSWLGNPLDQKVEIEYNYPVEIGPTYWDVTFKDSKGNPVDFIREEIGKKVTFTPISLLSPSETYTVTIPEGAYKGESGYINDGIQFDFRTVQKFDISINNLIIPDQGFVDKILLFDAAEAGNIARRAGSNVSSYEWNIDGKVIGNQKYVYYTFISPGIHKLTLTIIDDKNIPYVFEKDITVNHLTDIRMTLKDNGYSPRGVFLADQNSKGIVYKLQLTQEGKTVYGEKIDVELYYKGVLQRRYNKITSKFGDDTYLFEFKPEFGAFGNYELVFTYQGVGYKEVIREPVVVSSSQATMTQVFSFRLRDIFAWNSPEYFEEAQNLQVIINGEKMLAYKKWDSQRGYYVYQINKMMLANTYYQMEIPSFKIDRWIKSIYVGKEGSDPTVISGWPLRPGGIQEISVNYDESSVLYPFTEFYFEGVSAKLVFDVEADWKEAEPGYYEIKSMNDRFNIKVRSNGSGVQKIVLDPGLELKPGENLVIRMVSKQGAASGWIYCPYFVVVPQPEILGQKLSISLQSGEYAVNWPNEFTGALGSKISMFDGVPVLDGGNFGIGGGMPTFEGDLEGDWANPEINLSFGASGGYGEKSKKKADTKYKKVKKVTTVGYEFSIEIEGAFTLTYDSQSKEWDMYGFYIMLIGDFIKEWSKGYDMMGVGFSAGVGVGGEVAGGLKVDMATDDTQYSGFIRITPRAFLRVSGDFLVASVNGYLNGWIPVEVHFPTGYIGADIQISAKIHAKALLWSKTIYEKNLLSEHWDNGKPQVVIKSLKNFKMFEDPDTFQLMSRDYINRQSVWAAQDSGLVSVMAVGFNENPDTELMMENMYPDAELMMVENQDELWLVWTDDNAERDDANRTQLRFAVQSNGTWSKPVWIHDDKTADFAPVAASTGNGVLMAWQNIGKHITEEDGLSEMLKNSEISVTQTGYTSTGVAPNIITLTSDDAVDHSPHIAAHGDQALLVWTKSTGLTTVLNAGEDQPGKDDHRLYYSAWNNGVWSTPEAISSVSETVMDAHLVMEGETGLLLYTLDMDQDLYTTEDREVFVRLYERNAWSDAIRLSNNSYHDCAPKAVFVESNWFITWLQEGNILYRYGLDGDIKDEERLQNIQGDYQIAVVPGEKPLVSLVHIKPGEDMTTGAHAFFYDLTLEQWGNSVALSDLENHVKAISLVSTQDGNINVAYTQADIITEANPIVIEGVKQFVETPAIGNQTDMKLLTYTPVHDVALSKEDGILLSTEFPLPEILTSVYVTVQNQGDYAEYVKVRIYDGDPNEQGVLIGETPMQLLPAHTSKELEIPWLVDTEEKATYHLYATIEPQFGVQEINVGNNTIDLAFSTADIAITDLIYENMVADEYVVTVTVTNTGGKTLDGATVNLESDVDGTVLETKSLGVLAPGQRTVVTYMISSEGLPLGTDGKVNLLVRVNPSEGITEDFTENNMRRFSLKPTAITVTGVSPGPKDKNVALTSNITLSFNMNVSEGTGYDRIRLIDENLNVISSKKELQGATLIVTPDQTLDYDTEYTLTIPKEGLGDAYGHLMEGDYIVSFTTGSYYPEVVFTYPGEGMENAAIDTQIRLKFNQTIKEGLRFSDITGLQSDTGTIIMTPQIQGEYLVLNYDGKLRESTDYTVVIPAGAVQNDYEFALQEDYVLVFTTGVLLDGDEEDADSGSIELNINPNETMACMDINGIQRFIPIIRNGNRGVIKIGAITADLFKDDQNTELTVPALPGMNAYTVEIPAEHLRQGESSLTIRTSIGSIVIPADLLSNQGDV